MVDLAYLLKQYNNTISARQEINIESEKDYAFSTLYGSQYDNTNNNTSDPLHPKFEINKIITTINQMYGEYLQNTMDMKVEPSEVGVAETKADIYNSLLRKYMYKYDFNSARDVAFKEALLCGMGAWEVYVGSTDKLLSFDKEVQYKKIPYAFKKLFWSGASDLKAADEVYFLRGMSRRTFEESYGEGRKTTITLSNDVVMPQDVDKEAHDLIYVLDIYFKVRRKVYIIENLDGTIEEKPFSRKKPKECMRFKVKVITKIYKLRTDGTDRLSNEVEIKCKTFPFVVLYGFKYYYKSFLAFRGIAYYARDAQRLYNFTVSAVSEILSRLATTPIFVTPEHMKGHENKYTNFNASRSTFLVFNKDEDEGSSPIVTNANTNLTGYMALVDSTGRDIEATVGRFSPSLGDPSNTTNESGKALSLQQQRGDLGTMELFNNLIRAVEMSGRITISFLDSILSERKHVLGKNITGEVVSHDINSDENNTLNSEEFDVVATVTASYQSRREETLNVLMKLMEMSPEMLENDLDLVIRNLDIAEKDEILKRMQDRKRSVAVPPVNNA